MRCVLLSVIYIRYIVYVEKLAETIVAPFFLSLAFHNPYLHHTCTIIFQLKKPGYLSQLPFTLWPEAYTD